MEWYHWLTGPLVGSIIGYITNDIAVRMMFRPHTEKRLFGRRVPFTPGLIPKERPRLARAIRDVLDNDLLSADVLENALLAPEMLAKVDQAADAALAAILSEQRTLRTLLGGAFGEEAFANTEAQVKRMVGLFLMEKIMDSGIERTVSEIAVAEARKRVSSSTGGIAKIFWDDKRSSSMEESLTNIIREMLATHGPDMIDGMIDNTLHDGLDTPVADLVARYEEKTGEIRAFIITQYKNVIRAGLRRALQTLDLGTIVEDKLNSLDMAELETLIMTVMKKELRAIVWLGALLGAIMGTVNTLVSLI